MTAIMMKTQGTLYGRRPRRPFFDAFIRSLIILCTAIAVVLSSISICDGHWLFVNNRVFGLWHFCNVGNDGQRECTTDLNMARVTGLQLWTAFSRSLASLAVVVAIFGLELLIISQVCEDAHSSRKWSLGSALVLASFALSFGGVVTFTLLLKDFVSFTGFTLTYWCEFIASFLFFLNGLSGQHINGIIVHTSSVKNKRVLHIWQEPFVTVEH
ncbi:voltage-dependent calcium channel gamma-like subunit [Latimeria chalumnae]|uniref:Transmembrane protein 37 n=1 Tax=Latimeria chalumnae TaxID=7897 RepID=H3BE88_LATCH|nr:PREDICTED: voltage-dependent calcium channel gamma-like subunit [Latimeria chalumnae]|eukprot:XP_005991126.1 PREDICTED: voltage-dependent calcium channel gamma-like subunit [Latimeria chalumnae]